MLRDYQQAIFGFGAGTIVGLIIGWFAGAIIGPFSQLFMSAGVQQVTSIPGWIFGIIAGVFIGVIIGAIVIAFLRG